MHYFLKVKVWINEHMLELPTPPSLDEMEYATNLETNLPEAPVKTLR